MNQIVNIPAVGELSDTDNIRVVLYQSGKFVHAPASSIGGGGGSTLSDFLTSLNELTLAEGDLIYASDADTAVTLAKGTAGQILTMNAGATAPEWDDPAAGPSSEFSDSVFRIQDNSDATKELAFQVSGIATGTTRTWNVPNVDLTFGAYAATLVNTADEAGFKAAVNLEIGTDVQAYDADLTTLGGLAKSDGNFIVGDGAAWVVESGSTARASLGVTIGTHVQAYSANLDEYAAVNPTAAGLALLDDADAAAQRATLDLEPGTDVQAYSAILASAAGLSLSAGDLIYATGASALARLGVGADGEVLTLASGVPSWAAGGGGGGSLDIVGLTDAGASLAQGDALVFYDVSATANRKGTVARVFGRAIDQSTSLDSSTFDIFNDKVALVDATDGEAAYTTLYACLGTFGRSDATDFSTGSVASYDISPILQFGKPNQKTFSILINSCTATSAGTLRMAFTDDTTTFTTARNVGPSFSSTNTVFFIKARMTIYGARRYYHFDIWSGSVGAITSDPLNVALTNYDYLDFVSDSGGLEEIRFTHSGGNFALSARQEMWS